MQPGDTYPAIIFIRDGDGAAVTGEAIGDLTIYARQRAAGAASWSALTHGATLTELGSGYYALDFDLPASAGTWYLRVTSDNGYDVLPNRFSGELEAQDYDSLYASIQRPVATFTSAFTLGATQALSLVAYRYAEITATVQDQNGTAVDLSGYTGLTMSVRTTAQTDDPTGVSFDGTDGSPTGFAISGSTGGTLSITIPEDASFFVAIDDNITAGSTTLKYEIVGNKAGDASKTVPLIRSSTLTLLRREVGS